MGEASSKYTKLESVQSRVEVKQGKIMVSGRYHRLPKKIEDDYVFPATNRQVLGTGYNGAVFQASDKKDENIKVAIKQFHLHGVDAKQKQMLETEVEIFLSMDHPHVCRLVGVYECDKMLNLVMECMSGGELFSRVKKLKVFSEVDAAHAAWQMLLAISYLHGKGIVHRDLKLENFLYEAEDSDHLKLIDFGFSHIWDPNTTMASSCGTLSYIAPEVLKGKYTSQCDMWSLGVIVFILLVGYMPFSGAEDAQIKKIQGGKYNWNVTKWDRVSDVGVEFVKKLLTVQPKERMTAEQALDHTFIKDHNKRRKESAGSPRAMGSTAEALKSFAEASHFRRAAMSVMAWSLTNEERAQVRQCFLAIDTTNSGKITLGDLKKVLKGNLEISDESAKPIFDALDTSNNEEINYTEFLAAMVSTRIAMHDELLSKTFQKFDVDNTGFISKDNLKKVLGDNYSGADIDALIKAADTDKTGVISYEEFISYLKNSHGAKEHTDVAEKLIDAQLQPEAAKERKSLMERGFGTNYLRCTTKGLTAEKDPSAPVDAHGSMVCETGSAPPAKSKSAEKSQCCVIS